MNLEQYTMISVSSMSFEEAKRKIKGRVKNACRQGLRLQGNASVQVTKYGTEYKCYDINQTLIKGDQKLADYDIICVNADSRQKAIRGMEILLQRKSEEGWEIQGGASVNVEFKDVKSKRPNQYTVYQTIIKEE